MTAFILVEFDAIETRGFGDRSPRFASGSPRYAAIVEAASVEQAILEGAERPGFYTALTCPTVATAHVHYEMKELSR